MPYIKPELRGLFASGLGELLGALGRSPSECRAGCLNYIISTLARNCAGPNYRTKNEVMGVLECAKLELYRMDVVPYEEAKIAEHGDVPTPKELRGELG